MKYTVKKLIWNRGRAVTPFGTYFEHETQGGWEVIIFQSNTEKKDVRVGTASARFYEADEHHENMVADMIALLIEMEE